VGDSDVRPT